MLRRIFTIIVAAGAALTISTPAAAFDKALAASYARLFQPVQGAQAGKHLHLMTPEDFVAKIKAGAPLVGVDVRTPAEYRIFTTALRGSLMIPISELFTTENLERIPTDQTLVVVCKSGTRATAAGTALRHIGFENVYILKGGFKALSNYLDARTANTLPGSKRTAQ